MLRPDRGLPLPICGLAFPRTVERVETFREVFGLWNGNYVSGDERQSVVGLTGAPSSGKSHVMMLLAANGKGSEKGGPLDPEFTTAFREIQGHNKEFGDVLFSAAGLTVTFNFQTMYNATTDAGDHEFALSSRIIFSHFVGNMSEWTTFQSLWKQTWGGCTSDARKRI